MTKVVEYHPGIPAKTIMTIPMGEFLEWRKRTVQGALSAFSLHDNVIIADAEDDVICDCCNKDVKTKEVHILEQNSLLCDTCVLRYQQ